MALFDTVSIFVVVVTDEWRTAFLDALQLSCAPGVLLVKLEIIYVAMGKAVARAVVQLLVVPTLRNALSGILHPIFFAFVYTNPFVILYFKER